MAFEFVEAKDNRRIAENEHTTNPDIIGFTFFDSCIGIVAILKNKNLFGIHLVLYNKKDEHFGQDPKDVQNVINLLGDKEKVIIVGQHNVWRNPDGPWFKAYQELQEKLGNPQIIAADQQEDRAKGVFHAKKVGDDIKVMLCIESEPGPKAGQTGRSSDNFSSQEDEVVGAKDTPIKFTLPDGISVQITDDNRNAPDPNVFKDVTNGREEKNPYIKELYVAAPENANENFFVCVEKV